MHRAPYLDAFMPNGFAIKSIENYLRKSGSALAPKVLVKLNPGEWETAASKVNKKDKRSPLVV
jgi:hypothetical protein